MCDGGLLPDIMHDILEGAMQYEIKLMLKKMIEVDNYFTVGKTSKNKYQVTLPCLYFKRTVLGGRVGQAAKQATPLIVGILMLSSYTGNVEVILEIPQRASDMTGDKSEVIKSDETRDLLAPESTMTDV